MLIHYIKGIKTENVDLYSFSQSFILKRELSFIKIKILVSLLRDLGFRIAT